MPQPGPGELLVRVHASSVNPADAAVAAGLLKEMMEYDFPVTLGRDYAGVVEAVGSSVQRYEPGDEVYGFLPFANPLHDGSWADYLVVSEETSVGRKPGGIDFAAAGAAPVAALTAIAALDAFDLAPGAPGPRARRERRRRQPVRPARRVGGNRSPRHGPLRRRLLPARARREQRSSTATRTSACTSARRIPTASTRCSTSSRTSPTHPSSSGTERLASPIGAAGEGPGRFNLMAEASTPNLDRLAELLDSGKLRIPIQDTYPLERAAEALEDVASTHTQGKRALSLA